MPTSRNAFGALTVDPSTLTRRERVDVLRGLAGGLQAGTPDPRAAAWLGRCIADWLRCGGALDAALRVEGVPTAAQIVARERRDLALSRFAQACGSDVRAARVLAALEPCPPAATAALDELRAVGVVAATDRTLRRARKRTRAVRPDVRM